LNILYLSAAYTTHDRRFLESFVGAGWRVTYLPLSDKRLDRRPLPAGVAIATWGDASDSPVLSLARRQRLGEVIAQSAPDVVIAGPVQSAAALAALAGAQPLITVSWGSDVLVDADKTARDRFLTRFALGNSAGVFGDCLAVRHAVHRHSSIGDDRIVTFPWGIDLDSFSPGEPKISVRRDLGWTDNEVAISTRSFEPVYAIDVLIRAFAAVYQQRPSARLLLIGSGSLDADIRGLIEELGIDTVVHAPGRIAYELLPDYFRSADLYVSSALSDGTSISLVEAMACGLPVVVSDSFGNLEWVRQGVNGALARPGDPESLAAAMLPLLANRDVAGSMAKANIETARKRANWVANFPQLVTLVETVAEGSGSTHVKER